MIRAVWTVVACVGLSLGGSARAQDAGATAIRVGGSVTEAVEVLRRHRIEVYGQSVRAMTHTKVDPDLGELTGVIDKQRLLLEIAYSKLTGTILGLTATMFPQQQHTKLEEIWASAKSVTLHDDGSYSVQFLPAPPPRDPSQLPKSVVPGARFAEPKSY